MRKSLCLLVIPVLLVACGRWTKKEDPELGQSFLSARQSISIRNATFSTRFPSAQTQYQDTYVDVHQLDLDPQRADSDDTSSGLLSVRGGSNPNGRGFDTEADLLAYEKENYVACIGLSMPVSYSSGEFQTDVGRQTINGQSFAVYDFKVNYGGKSNRVKVRNWYLWISQYRSIIVRVMSGIYSIDELWQEQIDEINATLSSLQVTPDT